MRKVIASFAEVVDSEQDKARQDLRELLLIALCTILTGGKDCLDTARFGEFKAPFVRQFLRLRDGIASRDTFSWVFQLLDPAPFEACFTRFIQRFAEPLQGGVAIDSKTLQRLFGRAAGKSPLHMIHAWSADHRRWLGQLAFDGKSNEINAGPNLLDLLSLKGRIVTDDGPQPRHWPWFTKPTRRLGPMLVALGRTDRRSCSSKPTREATPTSSGTE